MDKPKLSHLAYPCLTIFNETIIFASYECRLNIFYHCHTQEAARMFTGIVQSSVKELREERKKDL